MDVKFSSKWLKIGSEGIKKRRNLEDQHDLDSSCRYCQRLAISMVIFFFMADNVDLVCLAVISLLRGFKDLHAALRETDGKSIGYLMARNFARYLTLKFL